MVGKTVTVGQYDDKGNLQEVVGTVSGTGTMDGEQVIFVNDKYYKMNEIMAVGTLPKIEEDTGGSDESGTDTDTDSASGTEAASYSGGESYQTFDDVPYENQFAVD